VASPNPKLTAAVARDPVADPDAGWTWLPSPARWLAYLGLGLLLDLVFVAVYGGTLWLNQERGYYLNLFADWELHVPLIPGFIYPYFSIFVLFLLPPFALRVSALRCLAKQLALATFIAGTLFLLFPTRLGFTSHPTLNQLPALFRLLVDVDLPYNLCPSLHVAYGTLTILAIQPASSRRARLLLGLWLALMCASVVLVHQHHLLDILGGIMLALAVRYAVRMPKVQQQQAQAEQLR
jgi:membrane-associated phospholipid phosphatase